MPHVGNFGVFLSHLAIRLRQLNFFWHISRGSKVLGIWILGPKSWGSGTLVLDLGSRFLSPHFRLCHELGRWISKLFDIYCPAHHRRRRWSVGLIVAVGTKFKIKVRIINVLQYFYVFCVLLFCFVFFLVYIFCCYYPLYDIIENRQGTALSYASWKWNWGWDIIIIIIEMFLSHIILQSSQR